MKQSPEYLGAEKINVVSSAYCDSIPPEMVNHLHTLKTIGGQGHSLHGPPL